MIVESSSTNIFSEGTAYKKIRLLLDNYRKYQLSDNITCSEGAENNSKSAHLKISETFLSNESVFESTPQLPDILLKKNNRYFDQNQSFFVPNHQNKHAQREVEKIVIKDYNPNYFFQKHFSSDNNDSNNNEQSSENLLNTIREGFQILSSSIRKDSSEPEVGAFQEFSDFKNFKDFQEENIQINNYQSIADLSDATFPNIDMQLELNYEMLNENAKWLIFIPMRHGWTFGPFGTADAFMFVSTKSKNMFPLLREFLIVDMDNECYLNTDLALIALAEEIMKTVRENERHQYFERHAVESHYEHAAARMFTMERKSNKFDLPRRHS